MTIRRAALAYILLAFLPVVSGCVSKVFADRNMGMSFSYPSDYRIDSSLGHVALLKGDSKLEGFEWDSANKQTVYNGIHVERLKPAVFHYFKARLDDSNKEEFGRNIVYNHSGRLSTARLQPPPSYAYLVYFEDADELWRVCALKSEEGRSYDFGALSTVLATMKKNELPQH